MEMSAMGGVCLSQEPHWSESVERIAAELQTPVELLQLSAEGLADHLRESAGDPEDISAAEALIRSAEKMRRIVQALIESVHGELP